MEASETVFPPTTNKNIIYQGEWQKLVPPLKTLRTRGGGPHYTFI